MAARFALTAIDGIPFLLMELAAGNMFAVAAQLRHVRGFFAVLAAVLAVGAALGDLTLAGRMSTLAGVGVHAVAPLCLLRSS